MKKRKKIIAGVTIGIVALLFGIFAFIFCNLNDDNPSSAIDKDNSYLHITYKGKNYSYNSRIIAVMFAGVDSSDELATYNRYTIAPRADTIEIAIFDDYNKKISVLAISRDTITSVARYTMNGGYRDNYDTHLGYAYTYGDGGKVSCDNLIKSVRTLLKGVPIHEYVVTNNSSVKKLNDMVGGVTVTVPNDDLVGTYPEFKSGAVVTLNNETAETFVRARDTKASYSNNGRMERQKAFSQEFYKKFLDLVQNDIEGTWTIVENFLKNYQTSIARNQYLDLAGRIKTEEFSPEQYYTLKGRNAYDEKNDRDVFYADSESLMKTVVELFYLEDK